MSTRLPGAQYRRVFDLGRSCKGRLVVAWRYSSPGVERQAGVVVSKKTFHDAVDRNRAKRQIREAYRLQKQLLIEKIPEGQAIDIAFIWLSDRPCTTADISDKVRSLLGRIAKKVVV